MNYLTFQKQFGGFPLIDMRDVFNVFPDFDRRRINEWQKKGYLQKVANNFYIFTDQPLEEEKLFFIANKIYEPSYVSLETALSYHGLIPEAVFSILSVSTLKTRLVSPRLSAFRGDFVYKRVKKGLFFGYSLTKHANFSFLMADPEKAILDFLYLREDLKTEGDFQEVRFNPEAIRKLLTGRKMEKYMAIAGSEHLKKKINIVKKAYARS